MLTNNKIKNYHQIIKHIIKNMGTFLSFTYQSQGGSTKEETIVNQDVIGYISSALNLKKKLLFLRSTE